MNTEMGLSESLSEAFDITEGLDEGADDAIAAETPTEEAPADVESDEYEPTAEEIEAAAKELEAEAESAEPELLDAPEHWSAEHREAFASLDRAGQEFLLDRHKSMESDYTKKTQEIADFRKSYEPVQEIFSQYPNLNPAETIKGWANIAVSLEQDPAGTLAQLAQQYNVALPNQMGDNEGSQAFNQLYSKINGLEAQIEQSEQAKQEALIQQKAREVETFKSETGENGELLRPFFDEAETGMLTLINGYQARGEEVPALSELYEQAVYANPDLRAKVLQAEKAQDEANKKAAAIARAKQAKKASKSIEGGSGSLSQPNDGTLRDSISAMFD